MVKKSKSRLSIRSKVWLVIDESHAFGSGLANLLEQIDRLGSLSRAAKHTGMSYRYAWKLIKNAEQHVGTRLTVPQPGGSGGGRSDLSADGRKLLEAFRRISHEVTSFAETRFKEMGVAILQRTEGVRLDDST